MGKHGTPTTTPMPALSDSSKTAPAHGPDAVPGVARVVGALPPALIAQLAAAADERYREIDALRAAGADALTRGLPSAWRYQATASSLALETIAELRADTGLLLALSQSRIHAMIRSMLGGDAMCDLDETWLRRQYAPHRYPPGHAPHSWHQDGALRRADTLPHPTENDDRDDGRRTPLPLLTLWVTLHPCGRVAPGLQFIARAETTLLAPAELSERAIAARTPLAALWTPTLEAGDALLFGGDICHRTAVSPQMRDDRTSIELRFAAAGEPPRGLAHHRWCRL